MTTAKNEVFFAEAPHIPTSRENPADMCEV